jgi:integrase
MMANRNANRNTLVFNQRAIEKIELTEQGKRAIYWDSKCPHLLLRVTHTAKVFAYQRTINYKKKQMTIGQFPDVTVDVARQRVGELNTEYAKGGDPVKAAEKKRHGQTFGELFADYRLNRPRRPGVACPTYDNQWRVYYKKWENKMLDEITYEMARDLIIRRIRNKEGKPVWANRVQALGKALFNYAINEWRYEGINPFSFAMVSEKGRARKTKRLYKTDIPNFEKALDTLKPGMALIFRLALYTGRRLGDIKAMRWHDVDLETGRWKTLSKTNKHDGQICHIPSHVCELLAEWKVVVQKSVFVFPANSKTGHVISTNNAWKKIREQGFPDLRANDLRGSFICLAQESGIPLSEVSQQVGHAEISTTVTHYTHIGDESLQKSFDGLMDKLLTPSNED